jgi:hypothetical protein
LEAEAEMVAEMMAEGRTPRRVNNEYMWIINKLGNIYKDSESKSLKDFVQKFIKAKTEPITTSSPKYMEALS